MERGHLVKPIQDTAGNLITGVYCHVRRAVAGAPVGTFENRAGETLANPIFVENGILDIYTPPGLGGAFNIYAYKAGFDTHYYDIPIASGAGVDANVLLSPGWLMAWEDGTDAPPTEVGGVRADNADLSAAGHLYIDDENVSGSSIAGRVGALKAGDTILLTDVEGSQASFIVAAVSEETGYYEIDVTDHDGVTELVVSALTMHLSLSGAASTVPGPQGESGKRFDLSVFVAGAPGGGEVVARHVFSDTALTFPAGLGSSRADAETAATAETVFSIEKNGSAVGSITFAISGTTGTFAAASPITVEAGDVLEVIAPGSPDATLADISITVAGGVGDAESFAASEISVTPAGDIAATDVQAALEELDAEKIAASVLTTTQDIIVRGASAPGRLGIGANDTFLGAAGGELSYRTPAQVRTSLGLATGDSPQFAGINLGDPADTTLSRYAAGVLGVEGRALYPNVPPDDKTAAYPIVLTDAGRLLRHPASDNNARTFTIPANSSVAFDIGTVIAILNEINTLTVAITSDTLVWAGDGSTGSRTIAAHGLATIIKVASTRWYISGVGIS